MNRLNVQRDTAPYLQGLGRLDEGPRTLANVTGATLGELKVDQRMCIVYGEGHDVPFQFRPGKGPL